MSSPDSIQGFKSLEPADQRRLLGEYLSGLLSEVHRVRQVLGETVDDMSLIDRAKYYYDLSKEHAGEADRYKKIYEEQMKQAISAGDIRTSDGCYTAYMSRSRTPSGELLMVREPDMYETMRQSDMQTYMEHWKPKMEQLRSIAASKYGLKGHALEEKVEEYCDPNAETVSYRFREERQ